MLNFIIIFLLYNMEMYAKMYTNISPPPSMKLTFSRWGGLCTQKFQPKCVNEESSTERRS